MIHYILLGEQPLFRAGVRSMLEVLSDIKFGGEAGNRAQALALIAETSPEVIVADMSEPIATAVELAHEVSQRFPDCGLILLDDRAAKEHANAVFRAGGRGYLPKSSDLWELETAVRAVASGKFFVSPSVTRDFLSDLTLLTDRPNKDPISLSPRQLEVLRLIAKGLTAKEIASRLRLSTKTVEAHRTLMMTKLGIHKAAGLVRYAMQCNIEGNSLGSLPNRDAISAPNPVNH